MKYLREDFLSVFTNFFEKLNLEGRKFTVKRIYNETMNKATN